VRFCQKGATLSGRVVSAVCYTSRVSSKEREELEEKVAEAEEATEQRMHSVAELLPQSEKVHERADRLSERAEEHRRRVERRRADDSERDAVTDEDLP
jgi:chromosome segregation ATPase